MPRKGKARKFARMGAAMAMAHIASQPLVSKHSPHQRAHIGHILRSLPQATMVQVLRTMALTPQKYPGLSVAPYGTVYYMWGRTQQGVAARWHQ